MSQPLLPQPQLTRLILHSQCTSPLLLGGSAPVAVQLLARQEPPVQLTAYPTAITADRVGPTVADHDLVYVSGLFATTERTFIEQHLGSLRDYCGGLLIVEHPAADSVFSRHDFFSLGFHQLPWPGIDGVEVDLFQYSLHTYKAAPQWLNSRFWAHPERWNLDWGND